MKKIQKMFIFLAILTLSGTTIAQYDFEPLNFNAGCGGICSFGRGINDRGDVVGWGVGGVIPGGPKGFLLDKSGAVSFIEFPGASVTQANGINDRGDVVGLYLLGGPPQAYLRKKDGTYSNIDFPGSTSSQAWGINSRGQAVGQYTLPGDPGGFSRAYVSNPDGSFESFEIPAAMVPMGATLRYTRFRDINDSGQIVGYYALAGGAFPALEVHGFHLDKKGRMTPIDFPVGPIGGEDFLATVVHGINNRGVISGGYLFGDTSMGPILEHGFVRSKKGVYTTVDFPGARQTEIYKIAENGVIVGGFQDFNLESNAFRGSPD